MDPFGAGAALPQSIPPGHITSAHLTGKDKARIKINVAAHQEKENEKTGKREAEEEEKSIRPISEMLRAAVMRSVGGQHGEKMIGERQGTPTAISSDPKRGRGPYHHSEAAVDWCRFINVR